MRNVLRFLLPAAVLLAGLPLCLGWFSQRLGDRAAEESFALVEENVRRAAVECYALEGAYPQDFSYLAERYGAKMQQIALAWHWAKGVASPIIGATKARYLDDAVGALAVTLTAEDIAYLEEPYLPHRVVGAIDQNPADGSRKCSAVPISGFSVSGIPLGLIGSVF